MSRPRWRAPPVVWVVVAIATVTSITTVVSVHRRRPISVAAKRRGTIFTFRATQCSLQCVTYFIIMCHYMQLNYVMFLFLSIIYLLNIIHLEHIRAPRKYLLDHRVDLLRRRPVTRGGVRGVRPNPPFREPPSKNYEPPLRPRPQHIQQYL